MQTDSLIEGFSAVIETVQKHKRQGLALAAAALVVALAAIIELLFNTSNPNAAIFPALGFFVIFSFLQRRYKSQATRRVMPLLTEQIEGISFQGLGQPTLSKREFKELLPPGSFEGDHVMLSGSFGALWFEQGNVKLERSRGKSTETVFQGTVLRLPPLGLEEELAVLPAYRARKGPSKLALSLSSAFSKPLVISATSETGVQEQAPLLTKLINETNALFVDGATVEAAFATPESTLIAVAGGSLPFHIGGLLKPRAALEAEIEAAAAELAAPIKIMQIWAGAAVKAPPLNSE